MGALKEVSDCGLTACARGSCAPVDCLWGKWAQWMSCTKCGGERKRYRHILRYPKCGGSPCHPSLAEEASGCPRLYQDVSYCEWGNWEAWSACSAKCGAGRRNRIRRLHLRKNSIAMRALEAQQRIALEKKYAAAHNTVWDGRRARWLVAVFALGILSGTVAVASWRCVREGRLPRYQRVAWSGDRADVVVDDADGHGSEGRTL